MNKLFIADPKKQERLETIMRQLGFSLTGRSVSERDNKPPMLTYWLVGQGDHERLLELLPGQGFGLARDLDVRERGSRKTVTLIIRQLAPAQAIGPSVFKEFGDA